jgi:hypothetical protein
MKNCNKYYYIKPKKKEGKQNSEFLVMTFLASTSIFLCFYIYDIIVYAYIPMYVYYGLFLMRFYKFLSNCCLLLFILLLKTFCYRFRFYFCNL